MIELLSGGSVVSLRHVVAFLLVGVLSNTSQAQSGTSLLSSISEGAASYAEVKNVRPIAVLTFPDLRGRLSMLSTFVSEQFMVDLANALGTPRSVVERSQVMQVLQEERLAKIDMTVLDAARIGKKLGANFVIVGTITVVGNQVIVNSRLVSTDSAVVVKAVRMQGSAAPEMIRLAEESAPSAANGSESTSKRIGPATEFGTLQVVITSAQVVRASPNETCRNSDGDIVFCTSLSGSSSPTKIRVNMTLTNRDLQRPLKYAVNATNDRRGSGYNVSYGSGSSFGSCGLGTGLRSSLVDSNGNVWKATDASGVSVVGVGCVNGIGDPGDIANAMSRQERLNGGALPMGAQYAYGTPSTLEAGQSATVTLTFTTGSASQMQGNPEYFQFNCELVIGTATGNGKSSYTLRNVAIQRVDLAPVGRR